MFQLLLVAVTSAVLSYCLKVKIERIVPVVVMSVAIVLYTLGLFMRLDTGVFTVCAGLIILTTAILIKTRKNKKQLTVSKEDLKYVISPQIIIAMIMCIIAFVSFSTHKVIHWDDLNVWGIYPKTLFVLNKIPRGIENCSVTYKDYQPLNQIMQYFYIYGMKTFNEARLFQINACFMYLLCMPLLESVDFNKKLDRKSVSAILMYVIFPSVYTTQFCYKLGVDYLISILFGLCLYYIHLLYSEENTSDKKVSLSEFYVNRIGFIVTMTYLAIIKNSGIVLILILLVIYVVVSYTRQTGIISMVQKTTGLFATPFAYYISWKVFSKYTGNTGYMSKTIDSNIKGLVHSLPEYTKEVLLHYLKNIVLYPLTREKVGITAIMIIAIIVILQLFVVKNHIPMKAVCISWICFVAFCIGHIYMYLFVFDEWEAHGLMEFDRYICQYLGGMLLFTLILLLKCDKKSLITCAILILFIVLLPYKSLKTYLIPKKYDKQYEKEYSSLREAGLSELNNSQILNANIPNDEENRIMIIVDAWDDSLMHFTFEAVPQVFTCYANIPAVEAGNLKNYIIGQIEDRNIKYVYVYSNAKEAFQGDYSEESKELTVDNSELTPGMYEVVDNSMLERMSYAAE